jgi:hypothetical protein
MANKLLSYLRGITSISTYKYQRNWRRYYNTYKGDPWNLADTTPLGYNQFEFQGGYIYDEETGEYLPNPNFNIVKSCVDTLCSKISNQKVRPIFIPISGDYLTRRAIGEVQLFFDDLLYIQNLNEKVTECFRS